MTKACIYARVSTISQKDGFGIQSQITGCKDVAILKGLEVVKIYKDEGISGMKQSRPSFDKMIESCGKEFSVVIVKNINRLGRNAIHILEVIQQMQKKGCSVCTCEGNMDTSTPVGKLMMHMNAGIAEFERSIIISRMKAGREERYMKDGENGGRMPHGFVRKNGKICIDEEKSKQIRMIFSLKKDGYGVVDISKYMTKIDNSGKVWRHSSVRYMLNNEEKYRGGRRGKSDTYWPRIIDF